MFHDVFQLYLIGIVTMVLPKVAVIKYRDKEEGQNRGSGESPDDGPGKSAPYRISGDDE